MNLFLSYRKLRYLYYKSRGDKPFHSPSSPPPSYLVNVQKQKGPGRLTRVIRVIKKRGFVPNRNLLSGAKPVVPGITVIKRKKGSGLNLTLSYRKLRYLNYKYKNNRGAFLKNQFGYLVDPTYLKIIFNSTILFVLAYLVVFLLMSFTTALTAHSYNIKSIVLYYKIIFLINNYNWVYDSILIIFTTAPLLALFVGFTSMVFINRFLEKQLYINILFIWLFCHGMIHFFGEAFLGVILYKGFGYSLTYFVIKLYTGELFKLMIIFLSPVILVIIGVLSTRTFLITGNYYFNTLTKSSRSKFLMSQFIIPAILGTAFLFPLKTPNLDLFEVFVNLCLFLILLPPFFRLGFLEDIYFDEAPRKAKLQWFQWLMLILLIIILIAFRFYFSKGVRID